MALFAWPWAKRRAKVMWGTIEIPQRLVNYHFYAAGTTGSGKSTLLRMLYRDIFRDVAVKGFDTRFLFYDHNSEAYPDLVAAGVERHAAILNPFDARCFAWNMAKDIRRPAQAKELAAVMVPVAEGPNSYFYNASRMVLEAALLALMKLKPGRWNFRDVLLACFNVEGLHLLAKRAEILETKPISDFVDKTREAKSVRMTLTVENDKYAAIAAAWYHAQKANRLFSINDWAEGEGRQILLIGASDEYSTSLATVNRLVIERARQLLLSYKKKNARSGRRTWVVLDEFPSLGALPNLEHFLTRGRKYGVCAVLGFQHIAHIQELYKGRSNAILGQCTHQAFFKVNDAEMAQWCASQFGRLIRYDEEGFVEKNDPAATENNFRGMKAATEKTGFECILTSDVSVLPSGPLKIRIAPSKKLMERDSITTGQKKRRGLDEADEMKKGFVPWDDGLELKPWDEEERKELFGTDGAKQLPSASEATQATFPVNPLFHSLAVEALAP
jgi:hypothetical protein